MSEYVWYKNGKEYQRSLDLKREKLTRKYLSDDEWIEYSYLFNRLYAEVYYKNDKRHRDGDEPAVIRYNDDGSVQEESYYKNSKRHRDGDKPAEIWYYEGGGISSEFYFKNGEQHRDGDKPARIWYYRDGSAEKKGSIEKEFYFKNGSPYTPE